MESASGQSGASQGFNLRSWIGFIAAAILTGLITGLTAFPFSYILEFSKDKQKTIEITRSVTANLAAISQKARTHLGAYLDESTSGLFSTVAYFLNIQITGREPVKCVFVYDAIISNKSSSLGIDDFDINFAVTEDIILHDVPVITSDPPSSIKTIKVTNKGDPRDQHNAKYHVTLLNPEQSISFSFFGYAKAEVDPGMLDVLIQKQDWVPKIQPKSSKDEEKPSLFQKKIPELTGYDLLILSLYIITFISISLVYVYFIYRICEHFILRRRRS